MKRFQFFVNNLLLLFASGCADKYDPTLRSLRREKHAKNDMPTTESMGNNEKNITLSVLNQAFRQAFSPFFVLVHSEEAVPVYRRGEPASEQLAQLAEFGRTAPLINFYNNNQTGVLSAGRFSSMTVGGDTAEIKVTVNDDYPLVSIAAMCEDTNDCFVALNGVKVMDGMVLEEPGLDAGSEENNESCDSVPGPFCVGKGNLIERSRNGEGYVHVHRGIMGIADLPRDLDWRNPMMRVTVRED